MPEKKWIFDTVVLSNFLLSDSAFLIKKRYHGRAIITPGVLDELSSGFAEYPDLRTIQGLIRQKIIILELLNVSEYEELSGLLNHLGKGEASCIVLARKKNSVVVTDERAARFQCAQMNIKHSGTIGILKASCLERLIDPEEADQILHRMISQGFYSPVRNISDIV